MMFATLIAAIVTGLAGSAHCFGMCGGMAGALGMRARQSAASPALRVLLYHLGRIAGYACVGAIGGGLGHSAHWALELSRFEATLRMAAGILTLLIGIRVLFRWNAFAWLERFGAKLWIRLRPFATRASANDHWSGAFATGLVWGWLPCGLVYSMVLMTLTANGPLAGAAMMAAFGLGTLPAMASLSLAIGKSWPAMSGQAWYRVVSGTTLLAFGIWMIVGVQFMNTTVRHVHAL